MQTLTRPPAPAGNVLLGSVVAASTEDLEKAEAYIRFELELRKARDEVGENNRRRTEERAAEVAADLEKFGAIAGRLEGQIDTSALEEGK